jgi:ribonuclease P protein component
MQVHALPASIFRAVAMTTLPQPDDQRRSSRQSLTGARLRKHADYQRAYAAGRKRQSASMSWFLAPQSPVGPAASHMIGPRVGLTAGKVLGKAHERNRIKRRMKEALRRHLDLLPSGCDLILHPRRTVLSMEFGKLEAEIVRILQQANVEAARKAPQPLSTTVAQPSEGEPVL